jgi:ABC-type transport system substrate-binding protein
MNGLGGGFMFFRNLIAGLFACSALTAAGALAAEPPQAPAAATPSAYTTAGSTIGALMDNPATKAVLDQHVPQLTAESQLSMARSLTLKQVQAYAGDVLSDEVLAKIDADLAKLSGEK